MKIACFSLFAILAAVTAGCGEDTPAPQKKVREICNNAKDDTGNGLIDCADPECASNIACGETCGNGTRAGNEVCDGTDLGAATCQSLGFANGTLVCNATCSGFDVGGCSGSSNCGNGSVEGNEICDGADLNGASCTLLGFEAGTLACAADCTAYNTSGCTSTSAGCGNGTIDDGETCDGGNLNGETCVSLGFDSGNLGCAANCQRYSTSNCVTTAACDGVAIDGPEECDGTLLDGETCTSQGFDGGALACSAQCRFDTSACTTDPVCGDGTLEGNEVCDGTSFGGKTCVTEGFASGTLSCDSNCTVIGTAGCVAPPNCGNGGIDEDEACDGALLNGTSCQDLGYKGGTLACGSHCAAFDTSGCTGYPNCGNGVVDGVEVCDGTAWASGSAPTCASLNLGSGTVACSADCTLDVSPCGAPDYCAENEDPPGQDYYSDGAICDSCDKLGGTLDPDCTNLCGAADGQCRNYFDYSVSDYVCDSTGLSDPDCGACGNGTREGGELCDGTQFITNGDSCEGWGFASGTIGCRDDCTPDFSACVASSCGDGAINGAERCDGSNFGGETCQTQGFGGGTLSCTNSCRTVSTASCTGSVAFNDGALNANEWCDGASGASLFGSNSCASFQFGSGTISCGANGVDVSDCQLWNGTSSQTTDVCAELGWFDEASTTEAFCDPCDTLNGTPDPDCAQHCGADGVCADYFFFPQARWTCPTPDPDCGTCGNDEVEGTEACDGTNFNTGGDFGSNCADYGFAGGVLTCRADCTPNFAGCTAPTCGDGDVEGNEVCDSTGVSCTSLGFSAGGTAPCKSDCTGYDSSSCTGISSCGNGVIDGVGYELCDGSAFSTFTSNNTTFSYGDCASFGLGGTVGSGGVTCNADCSLDLSACGGDLCDALGWRGDGSICDNCEAFGGAPDPDCDTACGLDGFCGDIYDAYSQSWPCQAKGLIDPDCGYCGNGSQETGTAPEAAGGGVVGEFCDGANQGGGTCATYLGAGATGTVSCQANCLPNVTGCSPPP